MIRTTTLAAALMSLALGVPAHAAASDAEVALLMTFAGSWQGSGKLSGSEEGDLSCRMTMKPSGEKLRYNGRCTLDGQGSRSFQGTIQFNPDTKSYEARSGGSDTVVGKKGGGGILFSFSDSDARGSMSSTMQLAGSTIRFAFEARDAKTSEVTSASIPFKKS
jgi:hypothetical protein